MRNNNNNTPVSSQKLLIAAGASAAAQGLVRSALLTKLLPCAGAVSFIVGLFGRKGGTETPLDRLGALSPSKRRPAAGNQNLTCSDPASNRSYSGATAALERPRGGHEAARKRSRGGHEAETKRSGGGELPRRCAGSGRVTGVVQPLTGGLSHGLNSR